MNRLARNALIVGAAVMGVLLFLLVSMSDNSTLLDQYYLPLFILNSVLALALLVLVSGLLWQLVKRYRAGVFGTRLTSRLVLLFALVGIVPGSTIYLVSVQFVSRSIESWFDVKVESALEAGMGQGKKAIEASLDNLRIKARNMAQQLAEDGEGHRTTQLTKLREQVQVAEAVIVSGSGRVLASASTDFGSLMPELPTIAMLHTARDTRAFTAIEGGVTPNPDSRNTVEFKAEIAKLRMRVVVLIPANPLRASLLSSGETYLQLIEPVPESLASPTVALKTAYDEYRSRSNIRGALLKMYVFALTLTLLLAIFAAIASALVLSDRLARPLLLLAEGTKEVAEGNLSPRPIIATSDELGTLTKSFNTMTRQLADARATVEKNRNELQNAKAYLESVLANMSAGVMVLDQSERLVTCNESVERILHRTLENQLGKPLAAIDGLQAFADAIGKAFSEHRAQRAASSNSDEMQHWQQQIDIPHNGEGTSDGEVQFITLLARGSHLPVASGRGYVVVFDDISNLISAQRSIAWGEVARRLAHEIKNPLTPIQLSAERLQMKLQDKLDDADVQILNKSTHTIVNQVGAMKRMVDDFRNYAQIPPAVLTRLDLNALIDEISHLYLSGDSKDAMHFHLAPHLPAVLGDATQLRQVIHNLLQNAQDAVSDRPDIAPCIDVATELVRYTGADGESHSAVSFSIIDNGPGFSSKILARAFEPYATSKPRGTGLGLPMVKKIIDEHGGRIDIQNRNETSGAKVSILLLKLALDS